jgi:hypothetical protein
MKPILAALVGGGLCAGAWVVQGGAVQDGAPTLTSEADRINYSVGYRIGSDFKAQADTLSPERLVQGMADAAAGAAPRLSVQEMEATVSELRRKLTAGTRAAPVPAADPPNTATGR